MEITAPLTDSVVRIRATDGRVIGAGFLVSDRHVLTCAHVVAQALGLPETVPDAPTDELRLDFPLVRPGQPIGARVVGWRPVPPAGAEVADGGTDIAVLELEADRPRGSRPVRLVSVDALWDHTFRAFGFPGGHDNGVWASGRLLAGTGFGVSLASALGALATRAGVPLDEPAGGGTRGFCICMPQYLM